MQNKQAPFQGELNCNYSRIGIEPDPGMQLHRLLSIIFLFALGTKQLSNIVTLFGIII